MEDIFDVFLVDKEGKKYSSEEVSSHIGIAYLIMEKNKELKKEFEESGKRNPLEFLLGDKGYITISQIGGYYKEVVYDSKMVSESQKKWVDYYAEEGYTLKDLSKEKEKLERGEW